MSEIWVPPALVDLLVQFLRFGAAAFHLLDLLLKLFWRELLLFGLIGIGLVHLIQVAIDIFIQLLDQVLELLLGEVAIPAIDGLELGTVDTVPVFWRDGDKVAAEKVQLAAEEGELPADVADCLAIIFAEIGDGLKVWGEPKKEPHRLHVTMGLAFQLAAACPGVRPGERTRLR